MIGWRETAAECRRKAERVEDPVSRRYFLQMARCYEDLAEQLERRTPAVPPTQPANKPATFF